MKSLLISFLWIMISATACGENEEDTTEADISAPETEVNGSAAISNVTVIGEENRYTFNVTIKSPDLGCNQYADWWEVLTEDGDTLIYRRILAHSHVDEQPFTRSGGAVKITKDQIVYVRAHMNTNGYGTVVYKGNVTDGFNQDTVATEFGVALETMEPLPSGCAF